MKKQRMHNTDSRFRFMLCRVWDLKLPILGSCCCHLRAFACLVISMSRSSASVGIGFARGRAMWNVSLVGGRAFARLFKWIQIQIRTLDLEFEFGVRCA